MSISQYLHLLSDCLTPSLLLIILAQMSRSLRVAHHNLAEVTIHSQQIGCRFIPHLSPRYGSGRGAAASVITQNCWAGGTDVRIRLRRRREEGARLRVRKCAIGLTQNSHPPSPDRFGPRPDARQLPTLPGWFWPGTDWLSPLNIIQSHMLIVHRPAGIWHARET